MSRNTLIIIVGIVVLAIIALLLIQERNETPLEEAAESVGEAADEFKDEVDD